MIRVLHVITRLTVGGAAENTVASMLALADAGYEGMLALGCRDSDAAVLQDAARRGCRLVDVPDLRRDVGPRRDLTALVRLTLGMRRERPLIVHTHTSKAGFIGRAAARLARVPAVIHQPHGHIFYGYWGPRRTALYITLERCAARWTDTIVTLTGRGMEEHLARGIGRRSQYAVVPSGVPTTALRARRPGRAAVRARLGIPADAFVIVAVGRLVAVKGFDVAVRALSRLRAAVPSATLLLVGDGPERHALEAQARAEGVAAAVRTTGVVDDVLPFLAGADVLAAPSRNEGMGRSIVEAMALGLPVVATRVGGIPDVVGEGETGRLVPVEDAAALATALIELASDPLLRAKLGDAAMDRAEQFSADEANRRMRDVYAALIRAKGLARPS